MVLSRDRTADVVRGIAVFTMICANLAPKVLVEPHPFFLRLYGSFAAPLFIFISGMIAVRSAASRRYGLRHLLLRGFLLILTGALIDFFVFRIVPFMTIDVLYLIGVALPLAALFARCPAPLRWGLLVLVFLLGPLLQNRFGYADYPLEFVLGDPMDLSKATFLRIFRNWMWEGWFPLFPWLGFSLAGAHFAKTRLEEGDRASERRPLALGLFFWILGVALWRSYPGKLLIRDGYSELFYPPGPGYLLTALGVIFLLFHYAPLVEEKKVFRPFELLGRSSLLFYILHLILIQYAVRPFFAGQDLFSFLLIYSSLTLLLILIAFAVDRLKARFQSPPFLLHFLWGG